MERYDLWPYFDMVVTALDVTHPKPHPESVGKILKTLKVDKRKTLYLGDSEVDRATASSSGVTFIAYKNRDIAEPAFIDDHLDVFDFLSNGEHSQE
jgi:phosphoglycolate phosphatase-like HAD superfamily hydrolase